MAHILESEPEMLMEASTKGLNTWKSLKPLSIDKIIQQSNIPDLDLED